MNRLDKGRLIDKVLIFDGAMGTMLQQLGLAPGACPELMNIEEPTKVEEVHKRYLEKGAQVITTNTFGGSRIKLDEYGLGHKVKEINIKAVEIAQKAIGQGPGLVAATLGPTGQFVEPMGVMTFQEAYEIYREQLEALAEAGPDFILFETFNDLGEIRAALLAALDTTDIPVICSLTYSGGRTLTGVSPASAAVVLESLGASAIGANCSGGPQELFSVVKELALNTKLPVMVQPNAGLPQLKGGEVYYSLGPDEFAQAMEPYLDLGINIFGSCCGSTPQHTFELKKKLENFSPSPRQGTVGSLLASREKVVEVGYPLLPKIIGERINPTARKILAEALRKGDFDLIQQEGEAQIKSGAHLLDVNVGTHGINEVQVMTQLINLLQQRVETPLVIDSTNPQVIEKALEAYQGKALVNSVNGEQKSLEEILPLIKRYGAGVIGLTLDEKGIPAKAWDRYLIAKKIVEKSLGYGIPKEDIYIDCLVLTVGADERSALETLEAIGLVKEKLGVNTVLGVSNVSHGLPNRTKINSAFLAMAIGKGLDMAIINPLDSSMRDSWQGASLLAGRDYKALNYIEANQGEKKSVVFEIDRTQPPSVEIIKEMVVKGYQGINKVVEGIIEQGIKPLTIIEQGLIPGLDIVGEKFSKGEYYLPQLMLSAETAQKVFSFLEKDLLNAEGLQSKGTIVIGTVKGDVHDIGKNMVAIMLKNHGYRVIDLGKNVDKEKFLQVAQLEKAQFVGLSALMTTTMTEMPKIIELLNSQLPQVKVIVGGAVITQEYATEIGADGYGQDAVGAVKVIEELKNNFFA